MNSPAEILKAFAERGLVINPASVPGMLAVGEYNGAKLSPTDAELIRQHKPALVAYLERLHHAYTWHSSQPKPRRVAVAWDAAAILRANTCADLSEAFLLAIEAKRGTP